jgi:uncharacterized membrane protein
MRFLRRLGLIAGSALLVSVATWWFEPQAFVFFGILHQIAVASVLALPFLWLPTGAVAVAAAAVIAAPSFVASPIFDTPALWWIGLSTVPPTSVDYVPLFPWFGVVLAGVVLGRLAVPSMYSSALARWQPTTGPARLLGWAGRWSLLIYLAHQPILVGVLFLALPYLTPNETLARQNLLGDCRAACLANQGGAETCSALCRCIADGVEANDLLEAASGRPMAEDQQRRWDAIFGKCSAAAAPAP